MIPSSNCPGSVSYLQSEVLTLKGRALLSREYCGLRNAYVSTLSIDTNATKPHKIKSSEVDFIWNEASRCTLILVHIDWIGWTRLNAKSWVNHRYTRILKEPTDFSWVLHGPSVTYAPRVSCPDSCESLCEDFDSLSVCASDVLDTDTDTDTLTLTEVNQSPQSQKALYKGVN